MLFPLVILYCLFSRRQKGLTRYVYQAPVHVCFIMYRACTNNNVPFIGTPLVHQTGVSQAKVTARLTALSPTGCIGHRAQSTD